MMKLLAFALAYAFTGSAFAGGLPERLGPDNDLAGYLGHCSSLTMFDRLEARFCKDFMGHLTLADGRAGFAFFRGEHVTVAFTAAAAGMRGDDGVTIYTVDRINFLLGREVEEIAATGRCEAHPLTDPNAAVTCEASTAKGRFAAEFYTLGGPGRRIYGLPDLGTAPPK